MTLPRSQPAGITGSRPTPGCSIEPWGIEVHRFDPIEPEAIADAARGARLVLVETPCNPDMRIVDIRRRRRSRMRPGRCWCATTRSPPRCSSTPGPRSGRHLAERDQVSGRHSDVLAECSPCATRNWRPAFAASAPTSVVRWDPTRLAAESRSSHAFAPRRPPVRERARHRPAPPVPSGRGAGQLPGLPDHPDHAIAVSQMNGGFGGLLSFEVADAVGRDSVIAALSIIHGATSLGGVESLIERRSRIEPEGRVPAGLLRLRSASRTSRISGATSRGALPRRDNDRSTSGASGEASARGQIGDRAPRPTLTI